MRFASAATLSILGVIVAAGCSSSDDGGACALAVGCAGSGGAVQPQGGSSGAAAASGAPSSVGGAAGKPNVAGAAGTSGSGFGGGGASGTGGAVQGGAAQGGAAQGGAAQGGAPGGGGQGGGAGSGDAGTGGGSGAGAGKGGSAGAGAASGGGTGAGSGGLAGTGNAGSGAGGVGGSGGGAAGGGVSGSGGTAGIAGSSGTGGTGGTGGGTGGSGGTGPACGNGTVEPGEACDDTNSAKCDGCEACELRRWLDLPTGSFGQTSTTPSGLSGAGAATYELWTRAEPGFFGPILGSFGSGTYQGHFGMGCENTQWYLFTNSAPNQVAFLGSSGVPTCDDGQWHHIAGVRTISGGTMTLVLYVDGVFAGTHSAPVSYLYPPSPLYVGRSPGFVHTGTVHVDEIRLSTGERYAGDFVPARRFTPDASTVALYHLDDGVGTTLADASTNGNDGVLTGTAWSIDTGYTAAQCGGGCVLDSECADGNPCTDDSCLLGQCTSTNLPDATPTPGVANAPADCKQPVCVGGAETFSASPGELPVDDTDPCVVPACNGTQESTLPADPGTPCGASGVCTGNGLCGVCLPGAKDCSGATPRLCGTDGQWQVQAACSAGTICTAGDCAPAPCQGIKLGGPSARISTPAAGMSIGTSDFTVEFWAKPHNEYANGQAIYHMNESYAAHGFRTGFETPTKQFYCGTYNDTCPCGPGSGNPSIRTAAVNDTLWHHVACVRQGATLTIYLDGQAAASDAINVSLAASSNASIGRLSGYAGQAGWDAAPIFLGPTRFSKTARYTGAFTPVKVWAVDASTISQYLITTGYSGTLSDEAGGNSGVGVGPVTASAGPCGG